MIGNTIKNSVKPTYNTSAIFYRYDQSRTIKVQIWIKNPFKDEMYSEVLIDAESDNRHVLLETSFTSYLDTSSLKADGRIKIEVQSMSNLTAI